MNSPLLILGGALMTCALTQAQSPEIIQYTFDSGGLANTAVPGVGDGLSSLNVAFNPSATCTSGLSGVSTGAAEIDTGWQMDLGTDSWSIGFHLGTVDISTSTQDFFGSSSTGGFRCFSGGAAGADGILLRTLMGGDVLIPGGHADAGVTHVVWVHDSTVPEVRGYLDGALVVTVPQTNPGTGIVGTLPDFELMTYFAPLRAGNEMDDFRIYRRAIDVPEIMAWMNCGSGSFPTFCDPMDNNSTGVPTVLTGFLGSGTGSGLHLDASDGPPAQFGYFLIGTGSSEPGLTVGNGRLCLAVSAGNSFGRYNPVGGVLNSIGQFDAAGNLVNSVGTSGTGNGYDVPLSIPIPGYTDIAAGETWHFQLWHREAGGASNFSNGISVTF